MEHSVLCLLTYTFTSDLLSGLAKIVDCFHSCYLFEDKLSSSTLFSVCLARSERSVEPCIQCSCAVGNICGSECIESYDIIRRELGNNLCVDSHALACLLERSGGK